MNSLSSKVFIALSRAIAISLYSGSLTKTTIVTHYIVFHGLIPISDGCILSSFSKKQKYIYQSKNKTICEVMFNVKQKRIS